MLRRPCPAIGLHTFGVLETCSAAWWANVTMCDNAPSLRRFTSMIKACITVHRRPARSSRADCNWDIKVPLIHIASHHMFKTTYSATRTSSAVDFLHVDLLKGKAYVDFGSGAYVYSNVSRRAIAALMLDSNKSLGFWVNANCTQAERTNCLRLA